MRDDRTMMIVLAILSTFISVGILNVHLATDYDPPWGVYRDD